MAKFGIMTDIVGIEVNSTLSSGEAISTVFNKNFKYNDLAPNNLNIRITNFFDNLSEAKTSNIIISQKTDIKNSPTRPTITPSQITLPATGTTQLTFTSTKNIFRIIKYNFARTPGTGIIYIDSINTPRISNNIQMIFNVVTDNYSNSEQGQVLNINYVTYEMEEYQQGITIKVEE